MDLKQIELGCLTELTGSGYYPVTGFCEYRNELSGPLKAREFHERCSASQEWLCSMEFL